MHHRAHGLIWALAAAPALADPVPPADYLAAMAGTTVTWHDPTGKLGGHQRFAPDGRTAWFEFPDGQCAEFLFEPLDPASPSFCYVSRGPAAEDQCWKPFRDAAGWYAHRTDIRNGARLRATPDPGRPVCEAALAVS